jgi:hypothetical protein
MLVQSFILSAEQSKISLISSMDAPMDHIFIIFNIYICDPLPDYKNGSFPH